MLSETIVLFLIPRIMRGFFFLIFFFVLVKLFQFARNMVTLAQGERDREEDYVQEGKEDTILSASPQSASQTGGHAGVSHSG